MKRPALWEWYVFARETWEEWLDKMTVLQGGRKAVDVMRDHGVNGPVLSPRAMSLKQMVAWLGKVAGNFTCLFIRYGVLKLLDGEWLTANDLLSSREYMLKPCPLNGRRKELYHILRVHLSYCVKLDQYTSIFKSYLFLSRDGGHKTFQHLTLRIWMS